MRRLIRGEKGYILIAALLVLVVVGLISGPVLSYMVSGLKAGHVFETGAAELYAADAGVEDAVLKIEEGIGLCLYESKHYPTTNVNGKSVDVTVTLTNNVTGTLTYKITSIAVTDAGGNTAGLGSHTTVESYLQFTPGAELDIFSGALASETSIDLGKDSEVYGDIYHCGPFDNSTAVNDDWVDKGCAPFPETDQNNAFAEAFKDEASKEGTHYGDMNIDSSGTQDLGPIYITGNLNINKDATIDLKGVVYVGGSIYCEKELGITGTGSLVAEGYIKFLKLANYAVTGDSIIMSLSEEGIYIKKSDEVGDLSINALIYAPNGPIKFDKDMTVIGGVVGESIEAAKDGSFTFVPKTSWDFPGGLPGAYTIETYDISRLS